jgi:protein TonB
MMKKKSCSDKNLLEYFSKNLRYPKAAKEAGVESTVVVRFIVNTDGSVGDVQVIKAGHPTLADEALRLINEMPAWRPGYQRGQAVRVQFILPFRIHLQ